MSSLLLVPTILSGLFPGAGQIYNREYTKGIDLVLLQLMCIFLVFFSNHTTLALIGVIAMPLLWAFSVVDASHIFDLPLVGGKNAYTFRQIVIFVIGFGILAEVGLGSLIWTLRNHYTPTPGNQPLAVPNTLTNSTPPPVVLNPSSVVPLDSRETTQSVSKPSTFEPTSRTTASSNTDVHKTTEPSKAINSAAYETGPSETGPPTTSTTSDAIKPQPTVGTSNSQQSEKNPSQAQTEVSPPKQEEVTPQVDEQGDQTTPNQEGYVVTLGTFGLKENAAKLKGRMAGNDQNQGESTKIRQIGKWYVVTVTGFETIDLARAERKRLATRFRDCFVATAVSPSIPLP